MKSDYIVTVYQVAEERGVPYLVMEYLEGYSLTMSIQKTASSR